jgi:hypothetical protein
MIGLSTVIDEKSDGEIWRLEIDEETVTLFVEVRNSAEKQVTFNAFGLENGMAFFKSLSIEERWLTGIEAAFNGVLLLHFYENETTPVHKGLRAIGALTGETLWSNFNITFDYLSINGPVVYDSRLQPKRLFLIDIKSGATIRRHEPSVDKEQQNSVEPPALVATSDLPAAFDLPAAAGGMAHYAMRNNFRIVSLHAFYREQLDQLLFIFEEEASGGYRQVFEDLMNTGIQKLQPEAFILHKNRLIYIKNRSELIVLSL